MGVILKKKRIVENIYIYIYQLGLVQHLQPPPPSRVASRPQELRGKLTGEPNRVTRRAKTRAEFTLDAQTSGLTHGCAQTERVKSVPDELGEIDHNRGHVMNK